MEIEVKQRNRRRKRAQRMQQQLKENKTSSKAAADGDESEVEDVIHKKPPRPPNRRKKQKDLLKEPLCEEDIVDGFSILQFRTYEDLELVIKIAAKEGIKRLTEVERPKLEPKAHITNHILVHNNHGLTLTQDPATSDDSGRASERLTGSSVAPRDADSSRDRLSDASSRCSSGKGYICDSEGEDDKENEKNEAVTQQKENKEKEGHQETVNTPLTSPSDDLLTQTTKNDEKDAKQDKKGSDASSVIFASAPRVKHAFPAVAGAGGALPPTLPPSLPAHGPGSSPVPAPTPPKLPAPSPAPAQQPPNHPPQAIQSAAVPVSSAVVPTLAPPPAQKGDNAATNKEPIVVGAKVPSNQEPATPTPFALPPPLPIVAPQQPASVSVPLAAPAPQPGAAPQQSAHHPASALEPAGAHVGGLHGPRTDSPAVATSATPNAAVAPSVAPSPAQYHHSYQPLYTPYAHTTAPPYPITNAPYPPQHVPPSIPPSVPPTAVPPLTSVPPQGVVPSAVPLITQPSIPQPISNKPPATMLPPHGMEQRPRSVEKRPMTPGKVVAHSPRGAEPPRERESYSNITTLSRSSVIPTTTAPQHSFHMPAVPAPTTTVSSSLASAPAPIAAPPAVAAAVPQPALVPTASKPWVPPHTGAAPLPTAVATRLSPAPPRPTPPLHSSAGYPQNAPAPGMFAPPQLVPPTAVVSAASPLAPPPASAVAANPNPFSAESLFQTNQADMLRRELDNRFLASQDPRVAPPPYLRTEMHQHQHHHTHVHQHTTSLLPPPSASALFGSGLSMSPMERLRRSQSGFKDIPKLGGVDSPFYRQAVGMPGYPGYNPGLMGHPGLTTGPTPFVPPNPMSTFQPKPMTSSDPNKPRIVKSGKWNAMHVRVAWEIYHHQQKNGEAKGVLAAAAAAKSNMDSLRTPSHLFSPGVHPGAGRPPHELGPYPPSLASHRPPGFDQPPHHPGSLFAAPPGALGKSPFVSAASTLSPFSRYGGAPLGASSTSPFSMSPFGAAARDGHLGLGPMHPGADPWRTLGRAMPGFPPSVNTLPPSLPGLPPGPAPWQIKPDPVLEQREREAREREERERERLRREREERERRDREEKQRRLEQQQQQERERERERREKERREMERRENERREREREAYLHQQRLAAEQQAAKQQQQHQQHQQQQHQQQHQQHASVIRDRSPVRNGQPEMGDIRVKEEPRIKEEDLISRSAAADLRYHPYSRHPGVLPPAPPSVLDRTRLLPPTLPPHYPPTASHWPPPPHADHFYRYGYPHLMDPLRVPDDRTAGYYGHPAYAPSQLRPKDPSLMHLRGGPGPPPPVGPPVHKMSATPPGGDVVHKKEEPR